MLAAAKPLLLLLSLFLFINVLEACQRCCPEIEPNYCFELRNGILVHNPECPSSFSPTFTLFTQSTPSGVSISKGNIPQEFSNNRKTVFIVHGWLEYFQSKYQMLKDALLIKDDYNVIAVDWKNGADIDNLFQANANTKTMGAYLGTMVNILRNQAGSQPNFWCIGHGMGAQVCGYTSIKASPLLDRITGVDVVDSEDYTGVSRSSALQVDVIHTQGSYSPDGSIGPSPPRGHVDFYPNGGTTQPGCLAVNPALTFAELKQHIANGGSFSCSHGRALEYMTHSINSPLCYVATHSCIDEKNIPSSCTRIPSNEQKGYMGHDAINHRYEGILYYEADNTSPYCSLP